ncbi:toxin [Pseudactinotalea terrae]|uniref:toxin n=1 Tax=Pseudactinotalea terrae TaxID=1743262 RepID=UPI0019D50BC8|nr:toxin [Pseudactinotalea terrae]
MPELHRSARSHFRRDRLDDAAVLYASSHVLQSRPLDDEDDPRRWLMIGADPAGRLLELVTLIYDDGYELIIHAMKARIQYLDDLA